MQISPVDRSKEEQGAATEYLDPSAAPRPALTAAGGSQSLVESLRQLTEQGLSRELFAREALALLARTVGVQSAAILAYEPRQRLLNTLASVGLSGEALKTMTARGFESWDIPLRVIHTHRINVIQAAHENPFVPPSLVAISPRSLTIAVIPFFHANLPVGVLVLFSKASRAFADSLLHALTDALRVCGPALYESPTPSVGDGLRPSTPSLRDRAAVHKAAVRRPGEPQEIERLRADLEAARAEVRAVRAELAAAQRSAGEAEARARTLSEKLEWLTHERNELQERLDQSQAEFTAASDTVSLLQRNVDHLTRLVRITSAADGDREALREAARRALELEGRWAGAQRESHRLEQAAQGLANALAEARVQERGLQKELEKTRIALYQLRTDEAAREELSRQIAELDRQRDSLTREIKVLRAAESRREAEFNKRIESLTAERAQLVQDLEDARRRADQSAAELRYAVEAAQRIREDSAERLEQLSRATSEREELRRRVQELEELLASQGAGEGDQVVAAERAGAPPEDIAPSDGQRAGLEAELFEVFALEANEGIQLCERLLLQLEQQPEEKETLYAIFRQLHTLKGAAAAVGLERIASQLHEGESLLQTIVEAQTYVKPDRLVDFLFRLLDSVGALLNRERGVPSAERVIPDVRKEIERLMSEESAGPVPGDALLPSSTESDRTRNTGRETGVRVAIGDLDGLLNEVGELVLNRRRIDKELAGLAQLREMLDHRLPSAPSESVAEAETATFASDLRQVAERLTRFVEAFSEQSRQFYRISTTLQREINRLRLVPLETMFRRLLRPVRDAARQTGKLVELQLDGGEVQLDRSLVEALYVPLLHLVRNAISHGIETPEVRYARGKDATGVLRIGATLDHDVAVVTVEDDGGGLDYDAILRRARRKGLIDSAAPTRDELLKLIFQPGFTTADAVTDLAGRGVGLDTVANEVASLGGRLDMTSEDARGTRVTLTLPIAISVR
jgi:chemosensory pili system protein ChpA (sensor histidine kinase/response regulator)